MAGNPSHCFTRYLLEALNQQPVGHSLLEDIHQYLEQYGHQIYTLDFVQPTQLEDPLPVLLSLKTLVKNEGYDFEKMKPDTILVCPTTTPAWTPLFAQASGLATDIGGILAHGSIVAREYGIPAVMGTGNVTRRTVSGQRITVDGDTGTVIILE